MGIFQSIIMLKIFSLLILLSISQQSFSEEPELNQTIEHLLNFVSSSECYFIRNGKSYDGEDAAEHIRKKYEYFKEEIDTPEKFIELAATKSTSSGEPYFVKCGEEAEILSSTWLTTELLNYRKSLEDDNNAKDKE
jgi:hypothetical protein